MSGSKKNLEDPTSSTTINNVPVTHWSFPKKDCTEIKAAAKWAWLCLEKLANFFCQLHCNRDICTIESPFPLFPDEKALKQWKELQKIFHDSISYLQALNEDGRNCPACAVTTAFTFFPLLMEYSPRPPIATLKMSAIEFGEEEKVFRGNIQKKSFPCYVIETELCDFSYETENYIRERALRFLDFDDLPAIPPNVADRMIMSLRKGQVIVNKLWNLKKFGTETNEEDFSDTYIKPLIKCTKADRISDLKENDEVDSENINIAKYLFKQDGDFWVVVFNGIELPHLRNLDGFRYIQNLLMNPDKKISALDLFYNIKGKETDIKSNIAKNMCHTTNDDLEDETSELHTSKGDKYIQPLDKTSKKSCQDRLIEIIDEINKAEENQDMATLARLKEESKFIKKELINSNYSYKKGTSGEEKARKNVSRRIQFCITNIDSINADLANYLRNHIKTGTKCIYSPDPSNPITWQF